MKKAIDLKKWSVNQKWVKDHTFAEFQKIETVAKLPYKEQMFLWKNAGGDVAKCKNKPIKESE